ncbi:extracellular serine-rich protein [Aspergillus oryzae 100-8]|uniref:Extracellular serine-rich protein n=1 Tax=Aspergillus oryzae (strain 3.042) TaxID=1160506 RepID=I7ZRC2_ASPO3|nr:extracellular serine-rich protein [Aspergillus oryzae 3.042]KDE78673.1 extracellular serine-rich protein [Aspergillus oryzae 100-8]|eukprot:EIT74529.1 extracellular serine-rich protein [Aspergillus oryzae 3.042]
MFFAQGLYPISIITKASQRNLNQGTTTTEASATATETSKGAATHTIQVGPRSDPHQYVPSSVNASVGDVIVFEFYPRNHSVVRADYDAPCVPAQTSGPVFYSGHFTKFNEENGQMIGPVGSNLTMTNPTFFYCTAIGSCNENGMVGVINPVSDHGSQFGPFVPNKSRPSNHGSTSLPKERVRTHQRPPALPHRRPEATSAAAPSPG